MNSLLGLSEGSRMADLIDVIARRVCSAGEDGMARPLTVETRRSVVAVERMAEIRRSVVAVERMVFSRAMSYK